MKQNNYDLENQANQLLGLRRSDDLVFQEERPDSYRYQYRFNEHLSPTGVLPPPLPDDGSIETDFDEDLWSAVCVAVNKVATPQQLKAWQLLVDGYSYTEAASALQIDQSIVSNYINRYEPDDGRFGLRMKVLAEMAEEPLRTKKKNADRILYVGCSIEGCTNKHQAKGLCGMHYARQKTLAQQAMKNNPA